MMNRISTKILFSTVFPLMFCAFSHTYAQYDEPGMDELELPEITKKNDVHAKENAESVKKLDAGVQLGTSFGFSPNNYFGNSYFVAPNLSYKATPRFTLSVGLSLEYTQLYPYYSTVEENTMLPMTRAFMYARGAYLLNSKVTVYTTAYKSLNDVPRRTSYYPYANNYDYSGFDIGMDYKISDSFSIGVRLRMDNGPGYYPYNNGINAGVASPFFPGY